MKIIDNLIMLAESISTDDSGFFRQGLSIWNGRKNQKVESFVPAGTFGKTIPGSLQLKLNRRGNESEVTVLEGDPGNRIIKDCKEGEFGIGNNKEKSYIYFKDGGDVETKTEESKLTLHANGTIELTGLDGVELISVIDEWMSNMINAKVITGIGLQPFDPITITNLTATQVKLNKLKA